METYSSAIFVISSAGIFISIIAGIIYALCKRTLKYTWLFACIAGFCFFTVISHVSFFIEYGDLTAPNYERFKNWNIYRFILSDVIRLFIWGGIGILNHLAFIKRHKLIKYGFILAAGILLIIIVLSCGSVLL